LAYFHSKLRNFDINRTIKIIKSQIDNNEPALILYDLHVVMVVGYFELFKDDQKIVNLYIVDSEAINPSFSGQSCLSTKKLLAIKNNSNEYIFDDDAIFEVSPKYINSIIADSPCRRNVECDNYGMGCDKYFNRGEGRCRHKKNKGLPGSYCDKNEECNNNGIGCDDNYYLLMGNNKKIKIGRCRFYQTSKLGSYCDRDNECISRYCANKLKGGRCAPQDGTGKPGEYCHHDNHCKSKICTCNGLKKGDWCDDWENGNIGKCE
jgi:hypothetical protein